MTNANLKTSLEKTQKLINSISVSLGWPEDGSKSYHVLRAILHALRDRLPAEQVANLAAQLPLVLRGLYYEGWKPANTPQKMNKEEFLDRVESSLDFEFDRDPIELINIVLANLRAYISEGEIEDIKDNLPNDINDIFVV